MAKMAEADQGVREAGGPGSEMPDAGVRQALGKILDKARVGTVFGEPITQDGVTVIPVARVRGKGGGGGGSGPAQEGRTPAGRGGGFGMSTRPVGVFVISGGKVSWRPSVDVNKIIIGGQIVAGIGLVTLRALRRSRRS